MAKLASAAALLAALLFIAHASAFTATFTTVVTDDERRESCREQIMRQSLGPCMRYMREQMSNRRSPNLEQCCEQMRDMDENCRCRGLHHKMMEQSEQLSGEEMRRMMEKAEHLPSKCNMGPQSCDFGRITL